MSRWASIELKTDAILFVDDDIVAVDKPSGVLSDASRDPNRDHLGAALCRWAGSDDAEFLPVHRLDLGTSGVVLYARHRAAATALMQQFQDRTVTKRYQAIIDQPRPPWQRGETFDRRSYLRHRKGVTEEVRSGGKPAETTFTVDVADTNHALIDALPKTGRTHQLRVHLAALGAPIVGDERYGGSLAGQTRLWLHAASLSLRHPATDQPLVITSRHSLALDHGQPSMLHNPS